MSTLAKICKAKRSDRYKKCSGWVRMVLKLHWSLQLGCTEQSMIFAFLKSGKALLEEKNYR